MYLIKPNLFCWIFYSTAQCRAGAKLPEKRRRSVLKYFIFEIFLMIPRFSRACQHAFTKVIESEIMLRIPFVPASRLKILKRLFHIKPPRKVPTRVWNLRISRTEMGGKNCIQPGGTTISQTIELCEPSRLQVVSAATWVHFCQEERLTRRKY